MKKKGLLWLILLITIISIVIDFPKQLSLPEKISFSIGPIKINKNLKIRKGLDLQGGSRLVLEADMKKISKENQPKALQSARNIIARRVDLYGVTEAVIQTAQTGDKSKIYVELPGLTNTDQAIDLIGKTAQLDFRQLSEQKKATISASPESTMSAIKIADFESTGLTGKNLKKAQVQFNPQTGEPMVSLLFNQQGSQQFSEITKNNISYPVAIFLDDIPITMPKVNEAIVNGQAVISGNFNIQSAKELTIQLNAGALPVPIELVEQKTIGATLGKESVQKSIKAGLIGLGAVIVFMIILYGFLGFLADIGLIIYGLITFALYKLIPVTLTLPGIAGFILSVGMAVDSNILIFEKIKEEKKRDQPLKKTIENSFGKAWDAIKDANICTLITCFVLFNPFNWGFLNTSGMIRGFALTLALGIGVSLFTGVIVTRTLIRVFYK